MWRQMAYVTLVDDIWNKRAMHFVMVKNLEFITIQTSVQQNMPGPMHTQ